ncbi:hypothetical protein [Calothrix sp. NIES-2098]|uniref:hypothetical protein n=1 Tax=Calothrix sp. NIES-2098 TaxID=1954171 RepID=UPI000B5F1F75|nr:hypothetical protein NIES2098_41950 [Calothrix sp. NIES-2098]
MAHTGQELTKYLQHIASPATREMIEFFHQHDLFTQELNHNDEGVQLKFSSPHEDYSVFAYSDNDWHTTHLIINEHYSGSIIFELIAEKFFLNVEVFKQAIAKIPAYDSEVLSFV